MMAAELELDESNTLLSMTIDLWRLFVCQFMDGKVQSSKEKATTKSEGIRKQLLATTCTSRNSDSDLSFV